MYVDECIVHSDSTLVHTFVDRSVIVLGDEYPIGTPNIILVHSDNNSSTWANGRYAMYMSNLYILFCF